MKKTLTLFLVALALMAGVLAAPWAPTATAGATGASEQDYLGRINALRASHGAGPLALDANLSDLAQAHTQWMIDNQKLAHTSDLPAGVTSSWQKLGENIGYGSSTDLVWNAFVNSPPHFENLVDPAFDHVGIAVIVDANGLQWTTHRFMQLAAHVPRPLPDPRPVAAPAPTDPPPTPAPTPIPAADPAPVPVTTPVTRLPASRPLIRVPVPTTAAPVPTTLPSPPLPVMLPGPADPERVASMLDALHASG